MYRNGVLYQQAQQEFLRGLNISIMINDLSVANTNIWKYVDDTKAVARKNL